MAIPFEPIRDFLDTVCIISYIITIKVKLQT